MREGASGSLANVVAGSVASGVESVMQTSIVFEIGFHEPVNEKRPAAYLHGAIGKQASRHETYRALEASDQLFTAVGF